MKYMSVKLTETTKAKYYAARSNNKLDAERPLGFIVTLSGQRMLFISVDGKFYSGILMPWQSNDMFMQMQFNEVRQFTAAQFVVPDAA